MSERVVLVTGALAGIGRATAMAFARQGAAVVVSGRRDEEGKALAAELRELGAAAEYIRADVSFGSIVNLSSTFGERGGAGAALYSASKHAVNGFTRSAALEVAAQGIRVNAVAAGPVATGGLGRFAGSEEG